MMRWHACVSIATFLIDRTGGAHNGLLDWGACDGVVVAILVVRVQGDSGVDGFF